MLRKLTAFRVHQASSWVDPSRKGRKRSKNGKKEKKKAGKTERKTEEKERRWSGKRGEAPSTNFWLRHCIDPTHKRSFSRCLSTAEICTARHNCGCETVARMLL